MAAGLDRYTTPEIMEELIYRIVKTDTDAAAETITISELKKYERLAGFLNQHIYFLKSDSHEPRR